MPLVRLSNCRSVICDRRGSLCHSGSVAASFSSHARNSPSAIAAAARTPQKLFVPLASSCARSARPPARAFERGTLMIAQRYPEPFIAPMRAELSRLGFEDLRTPEAVDDIVAQPGTTMIVVNAVSTTARRVAPRLKRVEPPS